MKRHKTTHKVQKRVRRLITVTVTRQVVQCERPYVLFGEAVRKHRRALDLTQQDLADTLKLSRGSIANIEVGRQRILLSDVFDFARALRVEPGKLFRAVQQ